MLPIYSTDLYRGNIFDHKNIDFNYILSNPTVGFNPQVIATLPTHDMTQISSGKCKLHLCNSCRETLSMFCFLDYPLLRHSFFHVIIVSVFHQFQFHPSVCHQFQFHPSVFHQLEVSSGVYLQR